MPRRDPLSVEQCAQLLKALGDPDRLRLIQALRSGPRCVSDLATELHLELANASHHLGVLRRAGLVMTSRNGKQVIYELPERVLQQEGQSGASGHLNLGCCRLEIPGC
ncbi:MAG: ArsR family transcriptional regulator [Planctomycetota bacterium]|nr:MAG: ArsR family transcriptional regulator [Planctomycetota bacterium]